MGEHRTLQSTKTIDALVLLGESLGYEVRREWEIPGTEPHPEQVDVALFVHEHGKSPAFVFEIDSADVPASTSNVVKIFGKTTASFVKPFFVFHVFIKTADLGHRRRNTETAFATQNYKTYDFADNQERRSFLLDLIDCHRAIRATVDIHALGLALDEDIWEGIDRYAVLEEASQRLNVGDSELADIAWLSLDSKCLRSALSRLVCGPRLDGLSKQGLTFVGRLFTWPLLLGMRAFLCDSPAKAAGTFREFREWQSAPEIIFNEKASMLGLSPEFDYAITELAPPMFCVVAMLFSRYPDGARELCDQLYTRATDGDLAPDWSCYALAWCAIAASKIGARDIAQKALDEINRIGGLPAGTFPLLVEPTYTEGDPGPWEVLMAKKKDEAPNAEQLGSLLGTVPPDGGRLPELVAEVLTNDDVVLDLNKRIIHAQTS